MNSFAAFFAVMSTVAMAGIWELVEWWYAVVNGGEAGAAFLGSQGDVWDAQKDILCDTLAKGEALRRGSLAREGNVANVEMLPIPIPISTERS